MLFVVRHRLHSSRFRPRVPRGSRAAVLVALSLLGALGPATSARAYLLAPASPSTPIHGEGVWIDDYIDLDTTGGTDAVLSSTPDGTGSFWVDDVLDVRVVNPDGSTATFPGGGPREACFDDSTTTATTACGTPAACHASGVRSTAPISLSQALSLDPGIYRLEFRFYDECGGNAGNTAIHLVGDASVRQVSLPALDAGTFANFTSPRIRGGQGCTTAFNVVFQGRGYALGAKQCIDDEQGDQTDNSAVAAHQPLNIQTSDDRFTFAHVLDCTPVAQPVPLTASPSCLLPGDAVRDAAGNVQSGDMMAWSPDATTPSDEVTTGAIPKLLPVLGAMSLQEVKARGLTLCLYGRGMFSAVGSPESCAAPILGEIQTEKDEHGLVTEPMHATSGDAGAPLYAYNADRTGVWAVGMVVATVACQDAPCEPTAVIVPIGDVLHRLDARLLCSPQAAAAGAPECAPPGAVPTTTSGPAPVTPGAPAVSLQTGLDVDAVHFDVTVANLTAYAALATSVGGICAVALLNGRLGAKVGVNASITLSSDVPRPSLAPTGSNTVTMYAPLPGRVQPTISLFPPSASGVPDGGTLDISPPSVSWAVPVVAAVGPGTTTFELFQYSQAFTPDFDALFSSIAGRRSVFHGSFQDAITPTLTLNTPGVVVCATAAAVVAAALAPELAGAIEASYGVVVAVPRLATALRTALNAAPRQAAARAFTGVAARLAGTASRAYHRLSVSSAFAGAATAGRAGATAPAPRVAQVAALRRSDLAGLHGALLSARQFRAVQDRLLPVVTGVARKPLAWRRDGRRLLVLAGDLPGDRATLAIVGPGYAAVRALTVTHGVAGARVTLPSKRGRGSWYVAISAYGTAARTGGRRPRPVVGAAAWRQAR